MDARSYLSDLRDELAQRRLAHARVEELQLRAWAGALALAGADAITDREAQWWGAAFRGDDPPGSPNDPVSHRRPVSMPSRSGLPPEPPWLPDEALVAPPCHLPVHVTLVELHRHGAQRSGLLRLFVEVDGQTREAGHQPPTLMRGVDDRGASVAVTLAASTGEICVGSCRSLTPESRLLSLEPAGGGGTQELEIGDAAAPDPRADAVDYTFSVPAQVPSGPRGLRRLELAANIGRLPRVFVEAGGAALYAVGLIDSRPLTAGVDDEGVATRVAIMRTLRRVVYLPSPEFAGLQLHSILIFDDALSIRWRQLPLEYRPDGPDPWKLIRGTESISDWRLTDARATVYTSAEQMGNMSGFSDPPFGTGEMVFVPAPPNDTTELFLRVGDRSARLRLPNP
jgi:hypothetical protein